ncbi:MAG: transporter [Paenibacillus sp.]|jgi:ABC-2 type transport system ATP-binding protein|nr:transporter [Paenibacillus sp.]
MSTIYEVDHLCKSYKKGKVVANQDIHFDVHEGEILGILGPNGAGKSTLIKQMVGHMAPTTGEIRFSGKNVLAQTNRLARNVAYYSQEPYALSTLRVWEALYFTGRLRGMNKKEALKETDELLDCFQLSELRNKLLKQTSGGEKRIVGIGTALIGPSKVLILDEPTNELDPSKRKLVWNKLQERNKQGGTIILVTHNVLEAEQVVDRVAVINNGKLLEIDHVGRLKQKVDQRLKFNLVTAHGCSGGIQETMYQWGVIHKISENRMTLLVEKSNASKVLDYIVNTPMLGIEEYSVMPPSLEDVYFHIDQHHKGGREA